MVNPQTSPNFGNRDNCGGRPWTSPIHATTADGIPITISFGRRYCACQYHALADGYVSGSEYADEEYDPFGPCGDFGTYGKYNDGD